MLFELQRELTTYEIHCFNITPKNLAHTFFLATI